MMRDKIHQIIDKLPDEELHRIYWTVTIMHNQIQFKKNLEHKGVLISVLSGSNDESEKIMNQWGNTFAQNVCVEIREAIHYDQFRWHIFSYEQQACLMGEEARIAFDDIAKDEIYVMYQRSPEVFIYKNAKDLTADIFDQEQDIYLFDREFTWTYVNTHESMCGPYFYKVK